ncbi:MAG: hypothetical protein EOO40_09135 [Deltaproteobacteria bacterium]|nr:MAG: hypothetical protein EOO40_09135 [Deltaproteobacteria bacterium]
MLLVGCPSQSRGSLCAALSELFCPELCLYEPAPGALRLRVAQALVHSVDGNFEDIATACDSLLWRCVGEDRARIIELICGRTVGTRQRLCEASEVLRPTYLSSVGRAQVLAALAALPEDRCVSTAMYAPQLWTRRMDGRGRLAVIAAVGRLPAAAQRHLVGRRRAFWTADMEAEVLLRQLRPLLAALEVPCA